jgi:hypothetical protein
MTLGFMRRMPHGHADRRDLASPTMNPDRSDSRAHLYGMKHSHAVLASRMALELTPRSCSKAALRLIPDYPRSGADTLPPVPAALPSEWLPSAVGHAPVDAEPDSKLKPRKERTR